MRLAGARAMPRRVRTALAALALAASLLTVPFDTTRGESPAPPAETRALWVLRTSMSSPQAINAMIRTAHDNGFNTLLVQVRGRGDAYFNHGIEPRAADLQRQPATFDPLATVLAAAHAAGLSVHAWVNINLVSSAVDLPSAPTHVIRRHPEWLMIPRDLAPELSKIKEQHPGYVTKLARWTRAQPGGFEGLYVSPIVPGALEHVTAVVRDLVTRYNVDGVHFDYARYPSERYDYSRRAIREFRLAVRPTLSAAARRTIDAREPTNPLAYPEALGEQWKAFRIARMTQVMARLRATIKAVRPAATITVAVAPNIEEARDHRLQDWSAWLQSGLVDGVCPMAYTPEPAIFAEQIAAARGAAGTRRLWAGIGAYRLPAAQTIENIATARRLGADGIALFSYDSLIDQRQSSPDYFALVDRGAFRPQQH
jgi:uncharacterized lipoprotein YddW (UPF0748 family)